MTSVMTRRRPKRTHSSLPPMLAAIATSPLAVATEVGDSQPVMASDGCRERLKARNATSQERIANSSQQCTP